MYAEENSIFGRIPNEIKSMIFSQLRTTDLIQVRLVCKSWQTLVDCRHISFLAKMTACSAPAIIGSTHIEFTHLVIERLKEFPGMRKSFGRQVFPSSTILTIQNGNSEAALFNILKETNCSFLYLNSEALAGISRFGFDRFLPRANWDSVIQLTLDNKLPSLRQLERMTQLLKMATLANLNTLVINIVQASLTNSIHWRRNIQSTFVESLNFIYRHRRTIRGLSYNFVSDILEASGVQPDIFDLVESIQNSLTLHRFSTGMGTGHAMPLLVFPIAMKSYRLTTITLCLGDMDLPIFTQRVFGTLIAQNSETLRHIDISFPVLHIGYLIDCKNLKTLRAVTQHIIMDISSPFNLPSLKAFEISFASFNMSMAQFASRCMPNLIHFQLIGGWGSSMLSIVQGDHLLELLRSPSLRYIYFGWALNIEDRFYLWSNHIPGLSWRNTTPQGTCLKIDRNVFHPSVTTQLGISYPVLTT